MTKAEILNQFVEVLCGDLDNSEQVAQELAAGQQVHPLAVHITRVCTHKIKNLPKDWDGVFILEESYYTYPGKEMEIKPLFFKVTPHDEGVYLESVLVTEKYDKKTVVNANEELKWDWNTLTVNDGFKRANYKIIADNYFITDHQCDFGEGLTFRLTETLTEDYLIVMETLKKDGVQVTPYSMPIIYKPR